MSINQDINPNILWYVVKFEQICTTNGYDKKTINGYCGNIRKFCKCLQDRGVEKLEQLDAKTLIQVFTENSFYSAAISKFLSFLYEDGVVKIDFKVLVPQRKTAKRLPSIYTKEEINKVLNSINRSKGTGKRNYLIFLLAARLGINSKQISEIKYPDVNENSITVTNRANKQVEMPMTQEIYEAMSDYVATKETIKSKYIISDDKDENDKLDTDSISKRIYKAFIKAGFTDERDKGVLALKDSLVREMNDDGTDYLVIAQGFGQSSKVIKRYKKTDFEKLRECALTLNWQKNEEYDKLILGENNGIQEFY